MMSNRRVSPAARGRRSSLFAMAFVAAVSSRVGAQGTLPAAPRASDVARLPSDSGGHVTRGIPASLVAVGPGGTWMTVLVGTPGMLAPAGASDPAVRRVASCLTMLGRADAVPPSPWLSFDSATAGRAYLVVQLVPSAGAPAACPQATDPVVAAAGYAIVTTGSGGSGNGDLLDATIDDAGHAVRPAMTGRVPAVVLGGPAVHELRIYLAPDALTPDAHGRFASTSIHVVRSDGRAEIALPDSVARRMWQALAPWRVARLPARTAARLPRLAAPGDSALARAASLWGSGDARQAASVAAERRAEATLARDDALFASLLVGSAFLTGGDSAGARAEYGDAARIAPCVRLEGAPAFARALSRVEGDSHCVPRSTWRLLTTGLAAPGGAQWARGDRFGAGVVATATLALAATAADLLLRAAQQHDAYTSAIAPPNVDPLLDRANATRASARRYAIGAAAVWASSAVIGVVMEKIRPPRPDAAGVTR